MSLMQLPARYIDKAEIVPEDFVVIVMGICGAGISSFISDLSGMEPTNLVGPAGSLHAFTTHVSFIRFFDPSISPRPIVLIDTPGFDAGSSLDASPGLDHILPLMIDSVHPLKVDATVYIQRIHDIANVKRHLSLCGLYSDSSRNRVVLLTTQWHDSHKDPVECEKDIRGMPWWEDVQSKMGMLMLRLDDDETVAAAERAKRVMGMVLDDANWIRTDEHRRNQGSDATLTSPHEPNGHSPSDVKRGQDSTTPAPRGSGYKKWLPCWW